MDSELMQIVTAILLEQYPDCRVSFNRKGELILRKKLINQFLITEWVDGSVDVERRQYNHAGIGGIFIGIIEMFLDDNSLDESIPATVNEKLKNLTPADKDRYIEKFNEWKPRYLFKKATSKWKITANILTFLLMLFLLVFAPRYNYYGYHDSIDSDILEETGTDTARTVIRKADGKGLVPEDVFAYLISDSLILARIDNRSYIYDADGNMVYDFNRPGMAIAYPVNPKCSKLSFYPADSSTEGGYGDGEDYLAIGNRLFRYDPDTEFYKSGKSDDMFEIEGYVFLNDGTKAPISDQFNDQGLFIVYLYTFLFVSLIAINLGMYFFRRRMRRRGLLY